MFDIIIQRNDSETFKMGKDITDVLTVTGTLREGTSIMTPSVIIKTDTLPTGVNYMTIAEFGRKYFITDIKSVSNGLVMVSGKVDVLDTYADTIKECSGILKRHEIIWNTFLNDGTFKTYSVPRIQTKTFPSGFSTTPEYILTVV